MKRNAILCGLFGLTLSFTGCQQTPEIPAQFEPELAEDEFPQTTEAIRSTKSGFGNAMSSFKSDLKETASKFRNTANEEAKKIEDGIDDIGQQFEPME